LSLLIRGTLSGALGDAKGSVYFAATEKDLRKRHLYRARLDGTGFERLTKETGMHSAHISPDGAFFTDTHSDVDEPPQIRLLKTDGSFMATLDKTQNYWSEYALATTELVGFKAADGTALFGRLAEPTDFDSAKKYPVIVFAYGGPKRSRQARHSSLTAAWCIPPWLAQGSGCRGRRLSKG